MGISTVSQERFEQDLESARGRLTLPKTPKSLADVGRIYRKHHDAFDKSLAEILSIPLDQVTFSNTVVALDNAATELTSAMGPLFLAWAMGDETELGLESYRVLGELFNELTHKVYLSQEFYTRIVQCQRQPGLNAEDKQLIESYLATFYINAHSRKKRLDLHEVAGLLSAANRSEIQFDKLVMKREPIAFLPEELEGVSEAELERMQFDGTHYWFNPEDFASFSEVVSTATQAPTRKKAWTARFMGASKVNEHTAENLLETRRRIAQRTGFSSWGEYALQGKSLTFKSLASSLKQFVAQSDKDFLAERREMKRLLGHQPAIWDVEFAKELKMRELGIDSRKISQYFPYRATLERLFEYAGKLFGYEIRKVTGIRLWEGATFYAVYDAVNRRPLGEFAVHPFPQEGKNKWYWAYAASHARDLGDGKWEVPFAFLNANIRRGNRGEPTLLSMEDYWTLFHELGHVLHFIAGKQRYGGLNPSDTNADLTEVPSVLLEQLSWEPDVIRVMGRHWKTGKPIPEKLVQSFAQARYVFPMHRLRDRVAKTRFDMKVHSHSCPNPSKAVADIFKSTYYPLPKGNFAGSFAYLIGYDGTYSTYALGEAFAATYLQQFRASAEGSFDPVLGMKFRRRFLEVAGTLDSADVVKQTLVKPFSLCSGLLIAAGKKGLQPEFSK